MTLEDFIEQFFIFEASISAQLFTISTVTLSCLAALPFFNFAIARIISLLEIALLRSLSAPSKHFMNSSVSKFVFSINSLIFLQIISLLLLFFDFLLSISILYWLMLYIFHGFPDCMKS